MRRVLSPRRWAALLALFFASGASGLVYEVVWMRLLSLTLSVTVYAVTTVLCAFMAGLAIGAAIAGPLAGRLRRPLFAYGLVELALGVVAAAIPAVLFHLGPVYGAVHRALGGLPALFAGARFFLAFGILLVPCTLMGMTLPLLSSAVIHREEVVARGAGGLYSANTLGAVAGCIAAGFALIPSLGLQATSLLAAGVSALVGVGAMWLGRDLSITSAAPAAQEARRRLSPEVRLGFLAIAISGFTALGYQVLWTRALEQFTHNSTYAYSAILATFLLGIAAGSAVAAPLADRLRRPLLGLGVVEILISASVVASLILYANLDRLIPEAARAIGGLTSWGRAIALIFGEASSILLVTTFLFGMTFPLVARAAVEGLDSVGERIGMAYTANTAGSILGALLVGFALLEALGMVGAFVTLIVLNAGIGVVLAWRTSRGAARWAVTAIGAGTLAAVALFVSPRLFEQSFVRRFGPLLFYREEVTDTVMVTQHPKRGRMIRYGDGRGTSGTGTVAEDRMYAEIPLLLHPAPRRVLNICFGVGNSLSSVAVHPVERIDSVELSPGVVLAAPFFSETNRDVLRDPRIHMFVADGRNFLLTSDERYDIIRLDPPELHTAGIVNLYTREFYQLARQHLAEGGIFSIWVNVVMTPVDDLRTLVRTVAAVFPHVTIWHGPYRYSWVINGSLVPRDPDLALLEKKLADPAVRNDLASIGIHDVFDFLAHFVMADDEVREFAGSGPIVTDDHTILDFTVPRSLDSSFGLANANTDSWLSDLMAKSGGGNVALGVFFRKVAEMAAFKRSVVPHLRHPEASGLTIAEIRERMAPAEALDRRIAEAARPGA